MRIVVDENIPAADAFARHGEVRVRPGRTLAAADVRDAEALIVRSVTRVDAGLLAGSRVRFVGTCTIGIDHLDIPWLESQGIGWSNAPGCNARSVVEYVLAVLRTLALRRQASLADRCFGIVGVGEVGQRLANVLGGLGWRVLLCDPPRVAGGRAPSVLAGAGQRYVELDELLEHADVLCLHTPLVSGGQWPTRHLLGHGQLRRLRPGAWLVNAGRGAVVDNAALLSVLQERPDLAVALDVWEPEPLLDPELAARCQLATPHIAGYSLDGKIRGTELVYQAFCRHFGLPAGAGPAYPPAEIRSVSVGGGVSTEQLLLKLAGLFYDPQTDDAALRATLTGDDVQRAQAFDQLRKHYPVRREMLVTRLLLPPGAGHLHQLAQALGMDYGLAGE